jgi:hypothetical protein
MSYCGQCGATVPEAFKFCGECGAEIVRASGFKNVDPATSGVPTPTKNSAKTDIAGLIFPFGGAVVTVWLAGSLFPASEWWQKAIVGAVAMVAGFAIFSHLQQQFFSGLRKKD